MIISERTTPVNRPNKTLIRFCVVMFVFVAVHGCRPASPQHQAPSQSFSTTVKSIRQDASVGTDDVFLKLINPKYRNSVSAPAEMREVSVKLAGDNTLRYSGEQFDCTREAVSFRWYIEIVSGLEFDAAMNQLQTELIKRGFESQPLASLVDLKPSPRIAGGGDSRVFGKATNGTEFTVIARSESYLGSSKTRSGVIVEWIAARQSDNVNPTVTEALAALPPEYRATYLDSSLYSAIGNQPIISCHVTGNGDVGLDFVNKVTDIVVKHLENDGFRYHEEHEPRNGRTTKVWSRFADSTYAYIETIDGEEGVIFRCQAPQHKGPPRTEKPLPVHPSLKLPRSKRPILKLSELQFARDDVKQAVTWFHRFADSRAEATWLVQGYKDERYSNAPQYEAFWKSADFFPSSYPTTSRPLNAIEIILNGGSYGSATTVAGQQKPKRSPDQTWNLITSAKIRGHWVPRTGWAAVVDYVARTPAYGGNEMCWARVGLLEHENQSTPFFESSVIMVTRPRISIFAMQGKLRYECSATLPWDASPAGRDSHRIQFVKLFESSETMRNLAIADLMAVRKVALAKITANELRGLDHTDVSSAFPPTDFDPQQNVPSDKTNEELKRQVNTFVNDRIAIFEKQHGEIHAALRKALPLANPRFQAAE